MNKNKPAAKKTVAKKSTTKKAAKKVVKKAAPSKPVAKKASVKTAPKKVVKKAAPAKAVTKKAAPAKVAVKKVAKKVVKKVATAKTVAKKAAPVKKVVKAVAKKIVKKVAPAKSVVKKVVVKKAVVKAVVKTVAKKVVTKKVAPQKVVAPKVIAKPIAPVVAPSKKGVEFVPPTVEKIVPIQNEILPESVNAAARVMFRLRAEKVQLLDLRGHSDIADFFLLGTCSSEAQMQAILNNLQREFKSAHIENLGVEYRAGVRWAVFDGIDVMVHLFEEGARNEYALDRLWRDGKQIELNPESYADAKTGESSDDELV